MNQGYLYMVLDVDAGAAGAGKKVVVMWEVSQWRVVNRRSSKVKEGPINETQK
jgi:hypothetical protein